MVYQQRLCSNLARSDVCPKRNWLNFGYDEQFLSGFPVLSLTELTVSGFGLPTSYLQYMCFVFQGFTVMRIWRPLTYFLSSRRRSLFSQVRHFTLLRFSQHARKSLQIHSLLMLAFVVSLYFYAGIITFWVNIMTFSLFGNISTASKPKTKNPCNTGV